MNVIGITIISVMSGDHVRNVIAKVNGCRSQERVDTWGDSCRGYAKLMHTAAETAVALL